MGITINHYQYNGPVTVPIYYNCIRGPPCSQIFSDVSEKSFFVDSWPIFLKKPILSVLIAK